jgi:RNA-directed DNA polymerase
MSAIEERIVDRHVPKLLRAMLRAGVLEQGAVRRSDTGTPQGGVLTAPTQSQTSTSSA